MANKIIKIPISDIDGLRSDGGYSFRYRIVSKDGNRKSEWSDINNITYQTDLASGYVYSFYERQGYGKPQLFYKNFATPTTNVYLDPHTIGTGGSPYDPLVVFQNLIDYNQNIKSSISISEDTEGLLVYSWDSLENLPYPGEQKFDVYLSYRDIDIGTGTTAWGGWSFAGTTTSNNFSFTSPGNSQYVQAAVFLSSYPKLTNIYNQITNFVSISSQFNVYRDSGISTVGASTTPAAGGKYSASITGLISFPAFGWSGRRVYADTAPTGQDRNAFGTAKVTVKSRTSANEIVVESNATLPAGSIYNLSLL